jgi:hypothetical protein
LPSEIVNLDELIPDDLTIRVGGQDYELPGDIDTETTFKLDKLMRKLGEAETKVASADVTDEDRETAEKLTLEAQEIVLELFRIKQPDMEKLPFGARGFSQVLARILMRLGWGDLEVSPPPPNRAARRAKPKKSPPSRSSRS